MARRALVAYEGKVQQVIYEVCATKSVLRYFMVNVI